MATALEEALGTPLFTEIDGAKTTSARVAYWDDGMAFPPPRVPYMRTPMPDVLRRVRSHVLPGAPDTYIPASVSYATLTWWQDVRGVLLPSSGGGLNTGDAWVQRMERWWDAMDKTPTAAGEALWAACLHEWRAMHAVHALSSTQLKQHMLAAARDLDEGGVRVTQGREGGKHELLSLLRQGPRHAGIGARSAAVQLATRARVHDLYPLDPDIVNRAGPAVQPASDQSALSKVLHTEQSHRHFARIAALFKDMLRLPMMTRPDQEEDPRVSSTHPLIARVAAAEGAEAECRVALAALEEAYDEFAGLAWTLVALVRETLGSAQKLGGGAGWHVPVLSSDEDGVDAMREVADVLADVLQDAYVPPSVETVADEQVLLQKFNQWVLRPSIREQAEDEGEVLAVEQTAHQILGTEPESTGNAAAFARMRQLVSQMRTRLLARAELGQTAADAALWREGSKPTEADVRQIEAALDHGALGMNVADVERVWAVLWRQRWFQDHMHLRGARAIRHFMREVLQWDARQHWMEVFQKSYPPAASSCSRRLVRVATEYAGPPRVTKLVELQANHPQLREKMRELLQAAHPGARLVTLSASL